MTDGTSGETVVVEDENHFVETVENPGKDPELFPDEKIDGPLSGVFRSAQRFRERIDSEE